MYPYELFWGVTLYDIFFASGILASLVCMRLLADKMGFSAKYFNFCLADAVAAVMGGYISSVVFQAFYNYKETGIFVINANTGMTFYGGLIGGALTFLLLYFIVGRFYFREDNIHIKNFPVFEGIASVCIPLAHGTGRIGCFFAGCCHGIATDSFIGVHMDYAGEKVLPVQLFETVFLYLLCAFLYVRLKNNKSYGLEVYMVCYGIWRFFIEYLRGDDRGNTIVSFLSPSQLTAVILIISGIILYFIEKKLWKREEINVEDN